MSAQAYGTRARRQERILLVDDHPLFRQGLVLCISRQPDLQVCGEAGSAAAALQGVDRLHPDLVITDLRLPGRGGLELIKDLLAQYPDLPVLVFSMHDETVYAERALRAGARGYLMKHVGPARLVQGIREVLEGRIALSASMATSLLEQFSRRPTRASESPLTTLTDRELEVLQLLGRCKSASEIAQQLHLSPKTVETHRNNLRKKLKLKTGAELIRYAVRHLEGEPSETCPQSAPSCRGGSGQRPRG